MNSYVTFACMDQKYKFLKIPFVISFLALHVYLYQIFRKDFFNVFNIERIFFNVLNNYVTFVFFNPFTLIGLFHCLFVCFFSRFSSVYYYFPNF